ncbi:hypothetical protein NQ315_007385 [Exocentrus adspersus]|uniref:Odorant receptor n=1 Tax=Exocentrus adspersus TaxID=1586481 RepID=A0AAV8VHI9_9CUCU|nr:hypothetical protein NQ315_007385 [Exocentrus adspersus]
MVPDNHFNHLLSKLFSAVMYLYCPVFALGLVYPFLLVMYLIAVASFQLDLLREEISTLYDCRHQELVHKKLVSCIQHHVRLLNFRNTWVKHSRLTMLCIPVSSLAPVGAGYFLINQVNPSSNFRMVLVLVIFVVSVTALCFTGQHFQDSFGNIFDAACQCPWFDWGNENKRVLMMLLMNSAKPVEISSYTTIALNLRLLMIFHKCIYSLITLLQ